MSFSSPTHSFEPELLKPTPRTVSRRANATKNMRGCLGCFLIPHTLVGLGLLAWLLWTTLVSFAGQGVPATITGRYTGSSDDGTTYFLRYSYAIAGQTYEKKASVTYSTYNSLPDGAAVTAKVFPLLPGIAPQLQVVGNKSLSGVLLLIMTVFWNGIVLLAWRGAAFHARGEKYLVARGIPTVGRILNKRVVTGSYGDSHYILFEWLPPVATAKSNSNIGPFASSTSTLPMPHLGNSDSSSVAPMMSADFKPFVIEESEPENSTLFVSDGKKWSSWREAFAKAKAQAQQQKENIEARKTPGALSREDAVQLVEWNAVSTREIVTVLVNPRNSSKSVIYKISGWQAQ